MQLKAVSDASEPFRAIDNGSGTATRVGWDEYAPTTSHPALDVIVFLTHVLAAAIAVDEPTLCRILDVATDRAELIDHQPAYEVDLEEAVRHEDAQRMRAGAERLRIRVEHVLRRQGRV